MPDALDVIVVCVEGGLSLPASFARVSAELREAHPLLADEMSILQREVQLGRTTGEALREFADRFDVDELRSLASVVTQAERFGASIVNALRVHADTLRVKRHQNAEAMAQKAPVKLIFPTVLMIFPALYIVLMGPAAVQLLEMLENL
jgi:tight adherence protein C